MVKLRLQRAFLEQYSSEEHKVKARGEREGGCGGESECERETESEYERDRESEKWGWGWGGYFVTAGGRWAGHFS